MNPTALDLRDIHLPPDPSWWPPAPGWWLLTLLLVTVVLLLSRALHRAHRRRRDRATLLAALADLRRLHPVESQPVALLAALSELLRRASKRHAPQALTLRDEAWLQFLDRGLPGQPFSAGPGRLLIDGPYRRTVDPADVAALATLVERRLQRFPPPALAGPAR